MFIVYDITLYYIITDATRNNIYFETTPFETAPCARPKKKLARNGLVMLNTTTKLVYKMCYMYDISINLLLLLIVINSYY